MEAEKKRKKKTMEANEKSNKCVRDLTIALSLLVFANARRQIIWFCRTRYKHGVAHLSVTLAPRWNFTPISQSAASLSVTRGAPTFKIHTFAFEQNNFLLLLRKCTGPSLLEELIYTTLRCVPDSRETPEKRKFKERPQQREGILRVVASWRCAFSFHTI